MATGSHPHLHHLQSRVISHPQPSRLNLQLYPTDLQMHTSLDNIPASTPTSSPSSLEPGDLPSVPYYATWNDLVDDYYKMTLLSPEDSSDSLPPALQQSQLSHSVRLQILQDSKITLDLLFEGAEIDSCMSKGSGYLAPPSDYVPFSPQGYINEPPFHFLPQDLLPVCHRLPHYIAFTPQFYLSSFGFSCSMTSVELQGGLYDDWTPPSSTSCNLGAFMPSAGPYPSRTLSPPNTSFISRSCAPTEDGGVE
ncbi:hypothetical protein EV702DRAFT_1201085 [Suillus placidus]|uniref:Uncharacterized protein n=1 Tax=Suillus placidus TaxID=48579 RepID=A0A9P6ZNG4_9AGAM|nr:hypothetical protein EV702DRAFT_1201085 [Suillus placidus]